MCLTQLQIICKNQSFSLHFLFKDWNLLKIRCSFTGPFYLKEIIESPDLQDVTFCIRIHGQSQDTLSRSIIKSTSVTLFCSRVLWALLSGLSFIICPCGMPCCPRPPKHTHWDDFSLENSMFLFFPPVNCSCLYLKTESTDVKTSDWCNVLIRSSQCLIWFQAE